MERSTCFPLVVVFGIEKLLSSLSLIDIWCLELLLFNRVFILSRETSFLLFFSNIAEQEELVWSIFPHLKFDLRSGSVFFDNYVSKQSFIFMLHSFVITILRWLVDVTLQHYCKLTKVFSPRLLSGFILH